MTRWTWLALSVLSVLNIPASLADDGQDSRQFNFNPGNMMGGMMNPMRGMFNGTDRDRGYYDNYYANPSYYGPPGYPGEYGYPGGAYAQPYPGYANGYPGYYAAPQPVPQELPSVRQQPDREPAPTYYEPQEAPPTYWQQPSKDAYSFRPMDSQPDAGGGYPETSAPYPQPGTYTAPQSGYTSGYEPMPQDPYQAGYESAPAYPAPSGPVGGYNDPYNTAPVSPYQGQSYNGYGESTEPGLKFRPLDQPGYSQ
ncbi:MAG: hypothetical protein ABW068_05130 [Candidatus Thiodiazotropha sp.]